MAFNAVLEADLRAISAESRRRFPLVKDAAEYAILKLRSQGEAEASSRSEDMLHIVIISCETKQVKLSILGLSCLQKLIAHDVLEKKALPNILSIIKEHSEQSDESIQLKVLQVILTLFQSKLLPEDEESMAVLLGACFRLISLARTTDSVHSTASATLRQAVALIFDRVLIGQNLPVPESMRQSPRMQLNSMAGDVSKLIFHASSVLNEEEEQSQIAKNISKDNFSEISQAARLGLRLFEELHSLAVGNHSSWLNVSSLPRAFALDMLEYTISHYIIIFQKLPLFEQALRQKFASLLIKALRSNENDIELNEPYYRKIVLRAVSTIIRFYNTNMTMECEVFLTMLIKSMDLDLPVWHRIMVLELLRGLCVDSRVLKMLFSTFDMEPNNTNIVLEIITCLARVVLSIQAPEEGEESLAAVAGMFSSKAKGVEWSMDFDVNGNAMAIACEGHAITLSLEALLGCVFTISILTDQAIEEGELESPDLENLINEKDNTKEKKVKEGKIALMCKAMVDSFWAILLESLSLMLSKSQGEAIILEILKGYQAFTQVCGILKANEARDAFLISLCHFTLVHQQESFWNNPLFNAVSALTSSIKRTDTNVEQKENLILTPKNVQALRTLFNISHRLCTVLGSSWVIVLETLAALDRTIHSPHAMTQEVSMVFPRLSRESNSQFSDFNILCTLDAQLFESSAVMGDAAVQSLLESLCHVSNKMLTGITSGLGISASGGSASSSTANLSSTAQQSTLKMFSTERIIAIVIHNLHRIEKFWDIIIMHILELINHDSPEVCHVALESLDRATMAALCCNKIRIESQSQSQSISSNSIQKIKSILSSLFEENDKIDESASKSNDSIDTSSEKTKTFKIQSKYFVPSNEKEEQKKEENEKEKSNINGEEKERRKEKNGDEKLNHDDDDNEDNEDENNDVDCMFECLVILPIIVLYECGKNTSIKSSSLRILLHVLERHGEKLSHSWPQILSLLKEVSSSNEKEHLPLGFQCVRVVINDCLTSIPSIYLPLCVELMGHFAVQSYDMNISLTSIGLLWTFSDFFAKDDNSNDESIQTELVHRSRSSSAKKIFSNKGGDDESFLLENSPSSKADTHPLLLFSDEKLDKEKSSLLMNVFITLMNLAKDERAEVRNSSIRTMFHSIVSHGFKFSSSFWHDCLWNLIFPLLESVKLLASTASNEEWLGKELGKQGGKSVHMLVHHSRNTAQKQWDETLVVMLNGMSRLLRSFLPYFQTIEIFKDGWILLLQFIEDSFIEGSKEVALGSTNCLQISIQTHAMKGHISDFYWNSAFETYEFLIRESSKSNSKIAVKPRQEIIENLADLYINCAKHFSEKNYLKVLSLVDVMIRHPSSAHEPKTLPGSLPQVQRTLLEVIKKLRPCDGCHENMWSTYIRQLLSYLPGGDRLLCDHCKVPVSFLETTYKESAAAKRTRTFNPTHLLPSLDSAFDNQNQILSSSLLSSSLSLSSSSSSSSSSASDALSSNHSYGVRRKSTSDSSFPIRSPDMSDMHADSSSLSAEIARVSGRSSSLSLGGQSEIFSPAYVYNPTAGNPTASFVRGFPETSPGALSYLLGEKMIYIIQELFSSINQNQMTLILPDLIASLGRCMAVRRDHPDSELWRASLRATCHILNAILPSDDTCRQQCDNLSNHTSDKSLTSDDARLWKEIADSFERFLIGACGRATNPTDEVDAGEDKICADEDLENFLLDCLCDVVLARCYKAPFEIKHRLISVIDRCSARTSTLPLPTISLLPLHCSRFSLSCLRRLFLLSSRGNARDEDMKGSSICIARITLPILLSRCDALLIKFAQDYVVSNFPIARTEEMIEMLKQLSALNIHPFVSSILNLPSPFMGRDDKRGGKGGGGGGRGDGGGDAEHSISDQDDSKMDKKDEGSVSKSQVKHSSSNKANTKGETSEKFQSEDINGSKCIVIHSRSHLLTLYMSLCDILLCREKQVVELVIVLLRLIGNELGLSNNKF